MRWLAGIVAAGVLATTALAASPLRATLHTDGKSPKVGARWHYTVHATTGGKPAAARLTVQIVDPLGGKHPVGFGAKKGNVTNIRFKGTFRDFVVWPKSSVGYPLTFRVTVKAGTARRVVDSTVSVKK